MAQFRQIDAAEGMLQAFLGGEQEPELFTITYLSAIRPNPRDLDQIVLLEVTARCWARDAREALRLLENHPPEAELPGGRESVALTPLAIKAVVASGVPLASMIIAESDTAPAPLGLVQ